MKNTLGIMLLTAISISPAWAGHKDSHVDVKVGPLTPRAAAGQITFNQNCASCHGIDGQGSLVGPPLIHTTYNPLHHDNGSFVMPG